MKKRQRPEQIVQRAVCDHLQRRRVPGVIYWHTPNAGKRSMAWLMELKRQGMLPGVSDLLLLHNGTMFALELKAGRNGPTEQQREFIDAVNNSGGFGAWASGVDQAVKILKGWELIR